MSEKCRHENPIGYLCHGCGYVTSREDSTKWKPLESMVSELLDGRAWSDLDNIEGAIFDRLQDEGFLRTERGIVVWTPIDAITRQRTKHLLRNPK